MLSIAGDRDMVWQWAKKLIESIESSLQLMYCPQNLTVAISDLSKQTEPKFKPELIRQQFHIRQQEKQQQFQYQFEQARLQGQTNLQQIQQQFLDDIENERQNFEVKLLKAQLLHEYYLQKKYEEPQLQSLKQSFDLAVMQAQLDVPRQEELAAFSEYWQNLNNRHKVEELLPLERKKSELDLKLYDREIQMLIAERHLQALLVGAEFPKILENHPLISQCTPTLDFYKQYRDGSRPIPPLILIWPPTLEADEFPYAARGVGKVAAKLTDELREFLSVNYDLHSQERPTKLLDGAYKTKQFQSEAALESLHWTHKSIPTLILESKIDGDAIRLYVGWWDMMETTHHYKKVISIPWKEILYPLVREKTLRWQQYRLMLLKKGKTLAEVQRRGGDHEINLAILEAEEEDREIDWNQQYNYYVNFEEYWSGVADLLVFCHAIIAGLAVDQYYLHHYNVRPKLPELLPSLLQQLPNEELRHQLIRVVVGTYKQLYEALKQQQPDTIPELALDLAQILTYLDDKSWMRGQLNYALQSWLQLRGVMPPANILDQISNNLRGDQEITNSLLDLMQSLLSPLDTQYVGRVNQCLSILSDNRSLNLIDAFYYRGINYAQEGNYPVAIDELTQVIKLQPDWAQAYYNRGLAYVQLEEYQKALEDYTQVLWLDYNHAEAYEQRGNVFHKLGEYEKAIVDYNQAIKLNPNLVEAKTNKDIAQEALVEVKRQYQIVAIRDQNLHNLQTILANFPQIGLPVTIIAGKNGSGKTTLLQEIIKKQTDLKLAILINEEGNVSIDKMPRVYTKNLDAWTYQPRNRANYQRFIEFVNEILYRQNQVDHLVIETSGNADLLQLILAFVDTDLKYKTHVNSIITVVDSENFLTYQLKEEASKNQILYSDIVLLNKVDLVSEDKLRQVERIITESKNTAKMLRCRYANLPLPLIFDLGLNKIGLNRGYLDDNSLSLFSYESEATFDIKKFEVFLDQQLSTNVFWGKGILWFEQSPKCHGFLLSGKRFSLYHENWKKQPENRLILIGENLDNEWLSYRLNDCRSEV